MTEIQSYMRGEKESLKKRIILILLIIIFSISLTSCKQYKNTNDDTNTRLIHEELSKKEDYLLNVTGNKVLMYNIKNLPKDKDYEISLFYEVYKNNEKLEEKRITGILNDNTCEKIDAEDIIINFQDDKIRYILGEGNGYASGDCDIKEKLANCSKSYLTDNIDLKLGSEIYIYHARTSTTYAKSVSLGVPISSDELDKILKNSGDNIFIKLVFKEI